MSGNAVLFKKDFRQYKHAYSSEFHFSTSHETDKTWTAGTNFWLLYTFCIPLLQHKSLVQKLILNCIWITEIDS
jgi:hypothetical protein